MSGVVLEYGYGAPDELSVGYGESCPEDGVPALGYGAPRTITEVFAGASVSTASEAFLSVTDGRRPFMEIGSEGGYFIEIFSTEPIFEVGVAYTVQLRRHGTTSPLYPEAQPGAYSSVPGTPYTVKRARGGRALRFATPALPHGEGTDAPYDVIISGGALGEAVVSNAVYVLPTQYSLQVVAARALPDTVYRPWAGTSKFPGSNEGSAPAESPA